MVSGDTHRRNSGPGEVRSLLPSSTEVSLLQPPSRPPRLPSPAPGAPGPALTLHVHADGLDGGHAHAVLCLAVVAAALRARDALDAQRLVEH